MAIGYGVACPKGPKRSTLKRRKERVESAVIQRVRLEVLNRDGDCRIARLLGTTNDCGGESEWAHLAEKKRFKTRGLPPEERHTTERSMMACTKHHQLYDRYRLGIEFLTERGADGPIAIRWREGNVLHVRSEAHDPL